MATTGVESRGAGCARLMAAGLLALVLGGCAVQPPAPSEEMLTASDESEARKRARIRLQLASGYYEQGKTEIALDEVKQAIAADPSYPDAQNLRGLILMSLGDNRQAEESFRRALALNPRDADVHHNLGWMQCQQARYTESYAAFQQAMANPLYAGRAKTLMALGLCQARAGLRAEAEQTLARSYELDAGNPITGYNLAQLLFQRGEFQRAQFYIRRLNNSELANSETLWLGIKVEQRMNDLVAMEQLGEQLRKRFPQSRERVAFDRRAFNE